MSPTAPATTVTPTLRRRRGLTEQAAVAAVDQACRRLRLPTVRAVLDEALTVAGKEELSYQGFLAELLLAECDDRDRRSSIRRVKAANFPRDKWLGDFDANPSINPATIHTLATGGVDPQRRTLVPHRRLRHRQVPPAHRARSAGGYCPAGFRFRRSSRLTVDGALPSPAAIERRLSPERCRSAMVIRSSSDTYRAENDRRLSSDGSDCRVGVNAPRFRVCVPVSVSPLRARLPPDAQQATRLCIIGNPAS
ncbi:UNVERIFIED_ORG: hypothetical protein ABIB52_001863 [Arthrobacter sp. UYCu721]